MTSTFATLLTRERALGAPGLAGSRVRVRTAIRDTAVNQWIAHANLPSSIESAHVEFGAGGRLLVHGAVRVFGFKKKAQVPLRIEKRADLSRGIVVQAPFDGASLVATAAGWIGPMLGTLPSGVALGEQGVTIDLLPSLQKAGAGDVRGYLRALELETDAGVLVITADLQAPSNLTESEAARPSPLPPPGARSPDSGSPRKTILGVLDEVHVDVALRVSDALATTLARAALELTDAGGTGRRPPVAVTWTAEPRISFHEGAAVVEASLRVSGLGGG